MALRFHLDNARRNVALTAATACIALFGVFVASAARPDNPPPGDAVGAIEGKAIAVTGPMSVETVDGQIVTILRSGSDVRVKSGSATIKLVEGGQIAICGPAHLSVLKSGTSLTIALDTGTIHAHIERQPVLTMYTPQIQAQPVAIGDSAQDTVVGFDSAGAMCIRANRGALRLEQQLTGQNVMVPQGGDVFLVNGQIDTVRTGSGDRCTCELQLVEAPPPPPEVSRLATTEEIHHKVEDVKPNLPAAEAPRPAPAIPTVYAQKPTPQNLPKLDAPKPAPPKEEPVYQVFVPPLIFDASAKVQPEVDPKMIVLIRHVRVRPTLIFQGRVEGDLVAVKEPVPVLPRSNVSPANTQDLSKPGMPSATTPPPPAAPPPATKAPTPPPDSLTERVRSFVRKLWPGKS